MAGEAGEARLAGTSDTPREDTGLCSEHDRACHHVQNHKDEFLMNRNSYVTCKGTRH